MLLDLDNIGKIIHQLKERHTFLAEQKEPLTVLDRDALLAIVRELYEVCLTPNTNVPVQEKTEVATTVEEEKEVEQEETVEEAIEEVQEEEEKPKRKKPTLFFTQPPKEEKKEPVVEEPKEEKEVKPIKETPKVVAPPPVEEKKEETKVAPKTVTPEVKKAEPTPPKVVENTPPPVEPKVEEVKPKVVEPSVLRQPRKEDKQPEVVEVEDKEDTSAFNPDYEELFTFKIATDLSQKIGEARINDLWHAIGINERFLYINQLFGGDMSRFKGGIEKLQSLANFDEARVYLEKEFIGENDWLNKQRKLFAKDFIKKVRRLYIGR